MTLSKRCACQEKATCHHAWWYEFELNRCRHRKSTRTNDKHDALKTAKRMRENARRIMFQLDVPLTKPLTIAEHVAEYVEWAKGDHPASAGKDRLTLARFLAEVGPKRKIDSICPFDIERWRMRRLKQGIARAPSIARWLR